MSGAWSSPFAEEWSGRGGVDVSRHQAGDALMVSQMVVVAGEVSDLVFEITGLVLVFEQDAVPESLMAMLELAQRLRMQGSATGVAPAIGSELAWLAYDLGTVAA